MSDINKDADLIGAARQLAESEIQLLNEIESSRQMNSAKILDNESTTMSREASNNETKNIKEKPRKLDNAKPSAAILAAKREAQQNKVLEKKIGSNVIKDIYQKSIDAREVIRKQTGITYDHSMAEHQCSWDNNYPERPDRYTRVFKRCEELGLIKRCKYIASRLAEYQELLLKHTPAHIELLKSTKDCENISKMEELSSGYDAIFFHPATYRISLLAAGSTINLVENICKGNIQNGMAIIRPPGHHAMKAEYCGYCFFNNVALAAEVALRNNLSKRILIVDWDVHHGQGTQRMFYNDPRVVYFSIHRYENGEFWPNLRESDYHYVGEKCGEGFNFNVPLNKIGMTNADYIAIFQQVLLPMAYEFQPDLIIVSAGYDAALGCPEGLMKVTPACYAHLLSSLLCLASGKVAVILEGGYCLKSLAEGAALTLRTLLGDPCPMLDELEPPCESIQDTILNVIYSHKPYWKCFQYQTSYNLTFQANNNSYLPTVSFNGPITTPNSYETRNCYPIQNKEEITSINFELDSIIRSTNLTKALNRVCIVYDERMLKHRNIEDDCHPEKPSRISSIFAKHKDYNLLKRCYITEGRFASEQEILLAHNLDYVNNIKSTHQATIQELEHRSSYFNSVYLHPESWTSARVSAGSLLQLVDNVLTRESQAGIAIARPPGHHATNDKACGFCIFNNIAIAAKYAVKFYKLKRVLIVDWDIHHGNGTQSILEDDPTILYISIHRYDSGNFFPYSKSANYSEVGVDKGIGFNVNIPWNKKGMGDPDYIAAFQQIVMPIAYQYNPELILVSAGFDACIADPLGGCKVSPEMYGHMTHWLSSLANGRVILTLEGGYNVNSIAHAMTMCTKALLGDPLVALEPYQAPSPSAVTTIMNVLETQKNYWPNLVFQKMLPAENVLPKAKMPRAKPTARLSSQESFLNSPINETPKNDEKQDENQEQPQELTDQDVQLDEELKNLKIDTCANNDESKQDDFNGKANKAVASSSKTNQSTTTSVEDSNETTLFHYLQDNLQALIDEKMFAVIPLNDCPHLDSVFDVPETGINIDDPCFECASTIENWICLQCYTVHCARSINKHALEHQQTTEHPLTLSFSDVSVWCYKCEAYIDNPRLYAARNIIHKCKFNADLPWTYSTDTGSLDQC